MRFTEFLKCLVPNFDFGAMKRHRQLIIDHAHADALRIEGYGRSWAACFPTAHRSHLMERTRNLMEHSEWLRADEMSCRVTPRAAYMRGV